MVSISRLDSGYYIIGNRRWTLKMGFRYGFIHVAPLDNQKQDPFKPWDAMESQLFRWLIFIKCQLKHKPLELKRLLHLTIMGVIISVTTIVWLVLFECTWMLTERKRQAQVCYPSPCVMVWEPDSCHNSTKSVLFSYICRSDIAESENNTYLIVHVWNYKDNWIHSFLEFSCENWGIIWKINYHGIWNREMWLDPDKTNNIDIPSNFQPALLVKVTFSSVSKATSLSQIENPIILSFRECAMRMNANFSQDHYNFFQLPI